MGYPAVLASERETTPHNILGLKILARMNDGGAGQLQATMQTLPMSLRKSPESLSGCNIHSWQRIQLDTHRLGK